MNVVIATLIAAILAALGTYLVAARQFSGKIESSAAADLWQESRAIREFAQARITELTAENRDLWKRIADLQKQVAECGRTIAELNEHIAQLEGSK